MALSLGDFMRGQAERKGLQPHPVLQDPSTPVSIVRSDGTTKKAVLSQREAKRHLDAYGGDQAMDWVMNAVRFTADTVAGADYHFEKPKKAGAADVPGGDEALDPPLMLRRLFEQPNPYTDYAEMMELLVIDLLLVGNAYLFKWRSNAAGQPLALYRLAPPFVKVKPTAWGVEGYEYDVPDAGKLDLDRTEVVHFKLANPHSPYYGLGLIQGAGRAADLELALSDTQASYYENHAMPSLALTTDRRVPRDVFKKVRAMLRTRHQGSGNAGELLVLEAGLKVASVAPTADKSGFEELTKLSRDRILSWFRLSPKLLGILDESGGADKIADAQRIFDTKTARPLMNKVQKKISAEIAQAWDLDFAIDYEYAMPLEDHIRLVSNFSAIPGVTVDEVRAYAKLGPHPDKTIGEMTLNLPGEEAGTGQPGDTPTSNGFPDRNLTGEAGRPPKASNTRAFPRNGGALPRGAAARKALDEAKSLDELMAELEAIAVEQAEGKAVAPDGATVSVGNTLLHERRPDSLSRQRETEVDAITADLERDLRSAARVLERDLLDEIEGKAFKPSDIARRLRNSTAWRTFTSMAEQALQAALKRAASTAAIHQRTTGLDPEDDIDYDSLVSELVHRKETGIRAITQTFRDRVSKRVRAERDAGKSQAELRAVIEQTVREWSENQVTTIALTEATRAYNESTLAVAESAGLTHVQVEDGDEHDEPCRQADGSVWSIDHAREHALEHPRCRRAFTPIPAVT